MSTQVLNAAWNADLPLSRKMVLIALADQANDHGESYPGLEFLRKRCAMGMRTVYEAIAALEKDGYLSRTQLPGRKTLYTLHLERLSQPDLFKQPLRQPQGAATAGCATRRVRQPQDAKDSKTTPAVAAPIEATKKDQKQPGVCDAGAREGVGSFEPSSTPPDVPRGTPQGRAAAALNRAGVKVTSMDPDLIAACSEGVTTEQLLEAAEVYEGKPAKYLIATVRRQRAAQATPIQPSNSRGLSHATTGPVGKTLQALQTLERLKRPRVAEDRDIEGFSTAVRVVAGEDPGG